MSEEDKYKNLSAEEKNKRTDYGKKKKKNKNVKSIEKNIEKQTSLNM